ncbi:MAG: hypothetical protein O6761_08245, partial [Thaumarchaeota archaeon]|nr:hypothetical protein [Nitrososphaerota archaeon]
LGKIPPGLMKFVTTDSPDDYWENHFEGASEDSYEGTYDGTNRGHSDGKGLFGAWGGKSGPGQNEGVHVDKGGHNDNFGVCGIPGKETTTPPIITLFGNNPLLLALNDLYSDFVAGIGGPEATVCDNIDDDKIPSEKGSFDIISTFDETTSGVYFVNYTATDSNGNITVETRPVTVGTACFETGFSIGSNSKISSGGNPNTIGNCTTIGNDFDLKGGYDIASHVKIGNDVTISAKVEMGIGVIIGNGVTDSIDIGNGVTIGDRVVIGDRVTIGNLVEEEDGVGVTIGAEVTIGDDATIGDNVIIGIGAAIASGATVPDNTTILPGASFP